MTLFLSSISSHTNAFVCPAGVEYYATDSSGQSNSSGATSIQPLIITNRKESKDFWTSVATLCGVASYNDFPNSVEQATWAEAVNCVGTGEFKLAHGQIASSDYMCVDLHAKTCKISGQDLPIERCLQYAKLVGVYLSENGKSGVDPNLPLDPNQLPPSNNNPVFSWVGPKCAEDEHQNTHFYSILDGVKRACPLVTPPGPLPVPPPTTGGGPSFDWPADPNTYACILSQAGIEAMFASFAKAVEAGYCYDKALAIDCSKLYTILSLNSISIDSINPWFKLQCPVDPNAPSPVPDWFKGLDPNSVVCLQDINILKAKYTDVGQAINDKICYLKTSLPAECISVYKTLFFLGIDIGSVDPYFALQCPINTGWWKTFDPNDFLCIIGAQTMFTDIDVALAAKACIPKALAPSCGTKAQIMNLWGVSSSALLSPPAWSTLVCP